MMARKTVSLDGEIPALLSSLCLRVGFPAGTAICSPSWDLCVCVCRFERDRDGTEVELCLSVEFIMTPAVAYWLGLVYMFSS